MFLDPRARTVYSDWADAADEQGAWLRGVRRTMGRVRRHAEAPWNQAPGVHPAVGEIRSGYEVLLDADEEQRSITWQPADAASAAAKARAIRPAHTGAEPRLRVV